MSLRKYKNPNIFWLLAISFFAILVPVVSFAGLVSIFADIVAAILISPFALLLELELSILTAIAEFNHFTDIGGVKAGWQVLRDLSNMFFIVILLIIAFATIIGIKGYGYKTLLSKLIIVAILINFSMLITAFFIDASQILMLTFVSAISGLIEGNVIVALGIADIVNVAESGSDLGMGDVLAALLLGSFMLIITDVVIMMIILILVARIVALWISIITSPIAFLASTFPKTQSHFNKWQEDLSKNLITGPSLLFFVWLAFTIAGRGNLADTYGNLPEDAAQGATGIVSGAQIFNFVIAISLLIAAIKMAQESGAAGAGMASKVANKAKGWASGAAKKIGGKMKRGAGNVAMSGVGVIGKGVVDEKGKGKGIVGKSRTLRRLAMRARTSDTKRKTEQAEEELSKVSPAMRDEYIKSKQEKTGIVKGTKKGAAVGGVIGLGGGVPGSVLAGGIGAVVGGAKGALDKIPGSKAKWDLAAAKQVATTGEEEEGGMTFVEAHEILKTAGDDEGMKKIQKVSTGVHDEESAAKAIEDGNLGGYRKDEIDSNIIYKRDAKGNIQKDAKGKDIIIEVKDGLKHFIDALLDMDPKQATSALGGMKKEDRDALIKGIAAHKSKDSMFDGSGNIDKGSQAYQQASIIAQHGNAEQVTEVYSGIKGDKAKASFTSEAGKYVSGEQIAKLDPSTTAFEQLAGNMNSGQRSEFLKTADSETTKVMVKEQVKEGNIADMMASPTLKQYVEEGDIQTYFNTEIKAAKKGDRDKKMNQLAKQNLVNAHLAFQGNDAKLDSFIGGLKKEEILKMDKDTIELAIKRGAVTVAMKKALKDSGYEGK